ncbi:MAG: hypothetical protein SOV62_00460 [Alloprevotella sp.]|nr:hypothetical protein [Alloprevotella sp.]
MSKEITIHVPDGKRAEWINGILTLVDEQKVDNRPLTERIKTFHDAYCELGNEHPFVKSYEKYVNTASGEEADVIAYLKLRIICAALNEGWKPIFDEGECRYYPWFSICSKKEYEKLDEEQKQKCRVVGLSSYRYSIASSGLVFANYASSLSVTGYGSRLAFNTRELAEYCGKQFIDIWADFLFS